MKNQKVGSILTKAKRTAASNERLRNLLELAKVKMTEIGLKDESKNAFVSQLRLIARMLKAHVTGEYKAFSGRSIIMLVFALVYFITPLDLIPDFIPALGFSDDISIVLFVLRSIKEDIDNFEIATSDK
jgi:uncharacterized membrane protein YkvA (DUF1232 family)